MQKNQNTIPEKKLLDAAAVPRFVSPLPVPPVFCPAETDRGRPWEVLHYTVDIRACRQQMLPDGFPATPVFGYGGTVLDPRIGRPLYYCGTPGPTFDARRGCTIRVRWRNRLIGRQPFAVDPTIHWANPLGMPMEPDKPWPAFPPGFAQAQRPVPAVTHLHGGENPPAFDGHPDAWRTAAGRRGPAFVTDTDTFLNTQQPATLWYHDHALGITRLNVYAGLAGFYLIRDRQDPAEQYGLLPCGRYEIPLLIQDKSFYADGSLCFPAQGDNPDAHPYWMPEFFGNTIAVNGRIWPRLAVRRHLYRLRVLNGSNARFYNLFFSNHMPFYQIGTDGGFLDRPVELTSLLLAPAERADLLVDFSAAGRGEKITLRNDAASPYPDGNMPDPETTGSILRFDISESGCEPEGASLPLTLNHIPHLRPDSPRRILTLNEVQGENGPLGVLLNGQNWDAAVSENPRVGSTEDWYFVNLTMDAHPIHLHLAQFEILTRQPFDTAAYAEKWTALNGHPPLTHPTRTLPFRSFATGPARPAEPNERGWKDTVKAYPGEVTRIRVRFAPQDVPVCAAKPGRNLYPFRTDTEPGYVWHCHILDHEDNEMMRPYRVIG